MHEKKKGKFLEADENCFLSERGGISPPLSPSPSLFHQRPSPWQNKEIKWPVNVTFHFFFPLARTQLRGLLPPSGGRRDVTQQPALLTPAFQFIWLWFEL